MISPKYMKPFIIIFTSYFYVHHQHHHYHHPLPLVSFTSEPLHHEYAKRGCGLLVNGSERCVYVCVCVVVLWEVVWILFFITFCWFYRCFLFLPCFFFFWGRISIFFLNSFQFFFSSIYSICLLLHCFVFAVSFSF